MKLLIKQQLLPKKCIQTINATSEKIARQEEGARLINLAFANAPKRVALAA